MNVELITKYPKIFRAVYWGAHQHTDEAITPEIINNRNQLVEFFGIVRHATGRYCYPWTTNLWCYDNVKTEMDHPEVYVCRDKRIVILVSNYDNRNPPAMCEMIPYPKIYGKDALTFIRVFRNLKELRAFTRQHTR